MTHIELAVLFSEITAYWYIVGVPGAIVVGNAGYYALPSAVKRIRWLGLWSAFAIAFFVFCGNHHRMMSHHLHSGTLELTTTMLWNDGFMALTTVVAGIWVWWWIVRYLLRAYREES